jgi:hypothetical protein
MDWDLFIKENLTCDPDGGEVYWLKQSHNNQRHMDKALGVLSKDGYKRLTLKSNNMVKTYLVHRLVWFLTKGYWVGVIDHINGNTSDNRIDNLREATRTQNQGNQRKTSKETSSKHKGVYFSISNKKWAAYINKDRKRRHLGLYEDEDSAAMAYDKAARELFGEFAKTNF